MTILRYVPHEHAADYLRLGWMVVAGLGEVHGEWSVLMEWPCQCRLVEPVGTIEGCTHMVHRVKCWRAYFADIKAGIKTFDLRRDDRKYKVGDILEICEWNEKDQEYTGEELTRRICYKLDGVGIGAIAPLIGLNHGYCILGLMPTTIQPTAEQRQ